MGGTQQAAVLGVVGARRAVATPAPVNFPREEYMEHQARAGMQVPKSCGFQPACEMQIVWSANARAKLRAITGKCGHMATPQGWPWHSRTRGPPPTAPSQSGAEHSHHTCISPGLCPLTAGARPFTFAMGWAMQGVRL